MLTHLELAACPSLSDDGIYAICCANPSLETLSLALNGEGITSDGMVACIRKLRRLRCLDISGCPQLWRVPLALARHCEFLEDLNLASVAHVCDVDVSQLFERCLHLRCLNLTGCSNVSEDVLVNGVAHASQLKRLVLNLVTNISEEALADLRTQRPACVFERVMTKQVDPDDLELVLGPRRPPRGPRLAGESHAWGPSEAARKAPKSPKKTPVRYSVTSGRPKLAKSPSRMAARRAAILPVARAQRRQPARPRSPRGAHKTMQVGPSRDTPRGAQRRDTRVKQPSLPTGVAARVAAAEARERPGSASLTRAAVALFAEASAPEAPQPETSDSEEESSSSKESSEEGEEEAAA